MQPRSGHERALCAMDDQGEAPLVGKWVMAVAVGVDHDCVRVGERRFVLDPAVVVPLHRQARHLHQPLLKQ